MSDDTRTVVATATEPLSIPPGYGMRVFSPAERRAALYQPNDDGLFDTLLVWELPRRGKKYVVAVDVSSGMGQDRSVIDVCRVGDLEQGEEQVAQFVSASCDPTDLAYIIDPIGRFYASRTDHEPALLAIEINGLGFGTQSELLLHVGYTNFFIWRYEDAMREQSRISTRYGWVTNQRTRALMLQRFFRGIKSVDPNTGRPDYQINSPHTIRELADFKTAGALWEGEGDPHDDCIMAGAIAVHVAQTLQMEQREPLSETRRRMAEERARAERAGIALKQNIDYQNTDISTEEMEGGEGLDFVDMLDNLKNNHYR